MSNSVIKKVRPFTLACGVALLLAGTSLVFGQVANTKTTTDRNTNIRSIPSGAKMKFKGVVIGRDADTFTIRDRSRVDYQVLLTDNTSIKSHGGFLARR